MTRNPHVIPLTTLVAAFVLAMGGALFMSAQTVHAEISGPCVASIAGIDVAGVDSGNRDDDIKVSQDDSISVGAVSPVGFESHKIQLEFGSTRWTVSEEDDDGSNSWTGTVNVDDYATWGVGLYKVIGESTLSDGTTCTGAATVDVDGNPLTTVVGAGAAVLTTVGVLGAVASGGAAATRSPGPLSEFGPLGDMTAESWREDNTRRRRGEETAAETIERFTWNPFIGSIGCFCLAALALIMTPLLALTGGGASGDAGGDASRQDNQPDAPSSAEAPRLPRAPWLPRMTLVGIASGFLVGVGSIVLMQQYSIEYPTLAVILRTVVVTMIIGGVVLPTIGYTISWLRINGRISRLEKEIQ